MSSRSNLAGQIGPPHEHKGPEDFNGKRDDDEEEEEDATPAPEEFRAPSQNPSQMMAVAHPGFQHVNHAPSASPPIHNGIPYGPRHATPQPQGVSRPSSRNHLRRVSSNIGGPPHQGTPPPPPHPNNLTYIPNPSIYNPNAPHNMNQQHPRPPQFAHFTQHPPGPQHPPPHPPPLPQHQHMPPHSMPPQTVTPQPMPHHSQAHPMHQPPPPPHTLAQPTTTMAMSQPPHPPIPQFLADQHHQHPQRTASLPDTPSADHVPPISKLEKGQSPPLIKPLSKSRSIFTPIDDTGSLLARNFFVGSGENHGVKTEPMHIQSEEKKPLEKPSPPPRAKTEAPLPQAPSEIKPPPRTNSGQLGSKRPQLKVQIPSENSDRGSATAESSSSAGNKVATPAKLDPSQPGVVLPPPSPSASAIHSAGATGPPNPFARPPPPATTAPTVQNTNAYNSNNNIETPISALPSRFVSDALLPSPSSFFAAEWGFGRSGPDSNILPSPLVFPTPQGQTGPGFGREEEQDKKRKSPDGGPASGENATKKTKT